MICLAIIFVGYPVLYNRWCLLPWEERYLNTLHNVTELQENPIAKSQFLSNSTLSMCHKVWSPLAPQRKFLRCLLHIECLVIVEACWLSTPSLKRTWQILKKINFKLTCPSGCQSHFREPERWLSRQDLTSRGRKVTNSIMRKGQLRASEA